MILDIVLLAVAIFAVVWSAGQFLTAAEKIGLHFKLSPFILGVVLVGFGTSLPELATSLAAVSGGVDTVTIPNVVGSNIANIFLIIGLATIVLGTVKFDKNLVDLDLPLLAAVTALFSFMLVDGSVGASEGAILLFGFVGYIIYAIGYKEDEAFHKGLIKLISSLVSKPVSRMKQKDMPLKARTIFMLIFSICLLAFSSKIAVDSLLSIVEQVDIAVGVVSFFALAIGTSLPELVVSFKALKKGQGDVVVGNIIGSNMFNILLICGLTSVIEPQVLDSALVPWLIAGMLLSVSLLLAGSISKRIHIWEGFTYLLIYVTLAINVMKV